MNCLEEEVEVKLPSLQPPMLKKKTVLMLAQQSHG